jgi:hypothetical protein
MKRIPSIVLFAAFLLLSCKKQFEGHSLDNLKINEIQVLGTHNSYAMPVDPVILNYGDSVITATMKPMMENMPEEQREKYKEFHPNEVTMTEALNYNHPHFEIQLDAGIRSLEIDVYYDPAGGRFANPASYRFFEEEGVVNLLGFKKEGLEESGFKVLHMADFDVRSHYPTFKDALKAMKRWSDHNPNHIPLYIMIEAKDSEIPIFPYHTKVLAYDEQAFSDLDKEILSVISQEKIICPDDVRQDYKTLREAILAKNWPLLKDSRGKFLFMLLPSTAGLDSDHSPYVKNHPNLTNRVMFMQSQPEDDFAAFLLIDNAIMRQEEIKRYVSDGYLVRTRSDIDTYEAKVNDYTRAEAAFSSGAQIISTDFFLEGKNTYGNDYRVVIPNEKVVRANPVNVNQVLTHPVIY